MSIGTIYTPCKDAAIKALIAAKLVGAEVDLSEVSVPAFQANKKLAPKFPLGTLPSFEAKDGTLIAESSAIAAYSMYFSFLPY